MNTIKKTIPILLLVIGSFWGHSLFAKDNLPSKGLDKKQDHIEAPVQKCPVDGEIVGVYSYSAPILYNNLRLQRRISYVNASSPVFEKMLISYFSVLERTLAGILLKNSPPQTGTLYSQPCKYYVFALRKIVV